MSAHYVEDFDRVLENLDEARLQIGSIHKDKIDVEELYIHRGIFKSSVKIILLWPRHFLMWFKSTAARGIGWGRFFHNLAT